MVIPSTRVRLDFVLILPIVLVLSLATGVSALAQPASGEIGIYLNPEGTARYITFCNPGEECGQEYYWRDEYGRDGFTAYVVANNLPGDVADYSLGLRIPDHSLITPHFPEGTNYAFTLNRDDPFEAEQITFDVTPPDCISSDGLIVLGSFDVVEEVALSFFFLVRLTATDPISGALGYTACSVHNSGFHQ
jgi:hypothetical protein